jgi:predicted ATPase
MKISHISVSNFKSYKSCSVDLTNFNVLIGANSAGKSNFIQAFKFLRDIVVSGLDNAVSMQGGSNFLSNINLDSTSKPMTFELTFLPDKNFKFLAESEGKHYRFEVKDITYTFSIKLNKKDETIEIVEDKLIQNYDTFILNGKSHKKLIASGSFAITKTKEKFKFKFPVIKNLPFTSKELECTFLIGHLEFLVNNKLLKVELLRKTLMLETPLFFMPHIEVIKDDIRKLSIYDFDPASVKQATSIAGKAELEESGENLAIVLKKILADEENKRKLFNLVQYVLPFVKVLEVEKLYDKYLQIVIQEKYPGKREIPAFLLSDGTIFVLSIIVALYFENKPIAIFEEPERRIHPFLISKMIDMMKDASTQHQIILSTHNPEIVKYAGADNLMFISRDEEGNSIFTRPAENEDVKAFMENEIGIEELFVQNLLGK